MHWLILFELANTTVTAKIDVRMFEVLMYSDQTSRMVKLIWPRGYKTYFMLNSTEQEISTAHKN